LFILTVLNVQVIARRLLESKTTIPHYFLTVEVNMDSIVK